jgi:hypothetical protein
LTKTKETIKNRGAAQTPPPGTSAVETGAEERDIEALTKPFKIWKRIGYTIYEVEICFNPRSRETLEDKILRLVRGEVMKNGVKIS